MKKLIAIALLALSLTTIKISAAQERVYYDFTFADGFYYDLKTGVGKSDARFAVSSRKPVKSDSITIVGSNWHHILWWGENNQYIGYHNSSKSFYKTNLFNAHETSYNDIDVIDNDSFVTRGTIYNSGIYNNDWVIDNIIPGVTYTMSYDVTLLYRPDVPGEPSGYYIAHFRLFNSDRQTSIYLAYGLSTGQYLDLEVGETAHVENTIKIPVPGIDLNHDLSGYVLIFATASHAGEFPIMRVDNVRLTVGDTVPTGRYFGTAGPVVTPPEGARYFNLQVCKDRDNLINFERDTPMGDFTLVNKNTIRIDFWPYRTEVVYEDLDYGSAPGLLLKYGNAYYIEYTITKLQEDNLNDDDVGIFFWWPYGLDDGDLWLDLGPPNPDYRLAQGIDNDLFQSLPIGEFARVTETFIADLWEWEGGPWHGRYPLPQLWVYTTKSGARMEFRNIYILPAGSYDMYITSIHIDPSEVYERFRSTQVYYEREAITPPEETNLAERVNAWLDDNNLNNNLFKTLVAVVVIVAVVIGLALLKAPGVAIIFSVVLVFALGVMFGWIPMWIVIPIALLCLGLIFLKLKGGGGGIDESD